MLAIGLTAALAESVSVGDLRLDYDDAWQRASAEEEAQAESVILRRAEAGGAVTVTIPRHQSRLRVPEARFYRQLEAVWRAGAGETLRLDWLEAGGRRWRVARRPSVEAPDRVVFHLVTVLDGRAHHLLALAPDTVDTLPSAVGRLLEGGRGEAEPRPDGVMLPAAQQPEIAQTAAPPVSGWRLHRVIRSLPGDLQLDRLLALERQALGPNGGISGVMVQTPEHGLTAGLEGFVMASGIDGRPARGPLARRWQVAWHPPPALWVDGVAEKFKPRLAAGSDRVVLRLGLRLLCGPPQYLQSTLQAWQDNPASAAADAPVGRCQRASGQIQAEIAMQAGEETHAVSFLAPDLPALPADEQALLVLTVMLKAPEAGLGQFLFQSLAVHYVYDRRQ